MKPTKRQGFLRSLGRDILKEGRRLLASLLAIAFAIILVFLILRFWIGPQKAKQHLGEALTGSWGPSEILGDMMKEEPKPKFFRILLPLQEGSHWVSGTSIRVDFRFLGGADDPDPQHFRTLKIVHEGPLQDTILLSARDEQIAYSRLKKPWEDTLANCRIAAEWFVPRVATSSTEIRGKNIAIIVAVQSLNAAESVCPALSADR